MASKLNRKFLLTEQVIEDLRSRVRRGEFADGRLPSERKLADEYGINRLTLRKATAKLEAMGVLCKKSTKGTFVSGVSASNLGKTLAYILIGRDEMDELHGSQILELSQEAAKSGSRVVVFCVRRGEKIRNIIGNSVDSGLIDGIAVTGFVDGELLDEIRSYNIPFVLLGHLIYTDQRENSVNRIIMNSQEYSRVATHHLLEMKARKVALVNGPSFQWFLNIYQGYMQALTEHGIAYDEKLVEKCQADTIEEGRLATSRILHRSRPDAIFAANDRLAVGAVRAIEEAGLTVPEDIPVIGVGDYEHGRNAPLSITTIAFEKKLLAHEVFRLVFSTGEIGNEPLQIDVPFRIIERASCPGQKMQLAATATG